MNTSNLKCLRTYKIALFKSVYIKHKYIQALMCRSFRLDIMMTETNVNLQKKKNYTSFFAHFT